jgi:hypothetical protein
VLVDRSAGGAKRKALARRKSAAARTATGLLEAEQKFRRIKGYQEIMLLKERLNPSRIQPKEVRAVEVA